jgi:hypothetical protein
MHLFIGEGLEDALPCLIVGFLHRVEIRFVNPGFVLQGCPNGVIELHRPSPELNETPRKKAGLTISADSESRKENAGLADE